MTDKTAAVRVEARDGGFRRFWSRASSDVDAAGKRMGKGLSSALSAGIEGGQKAVKDMFSSIRSGLGTLTGFASVGGIAALAKDAIDGREVFEDLSAAIEFGTGRLLSWQQLQKRAQGVARATGKDVDELGRAMETVYGDTKDTDYALETVSAIGTAARATGKDVDTFAKITGILNQKFGITAKDAPQALAAIIAGANSGGASLENLADDFGEIGGKAKTLGLQGTKGIMEMLGILNLAKQETGRFEQAMTALPQIFDQIIERGGKGGDLEKKLKIQTYGPDGKRRSPIAILQDIIRKTKGNETKLGELGFGGEGLQTILALAKPFQAELKRTGGDINAASEAFDRALDKAAGGGLKWSDVQAKAAKRANSESGRLERALQTAKAAMTTPQMLGAFKDLASAAPQVASGFAKLVDFVSKNPLTAGMIGTAGVFAKGATEAMVGDIFSQLMGGGAGSGGGKKGKKKKGKKRGKKGMSKALQGMALVGDVIAAGALVAEQYDALDKTLAGRSLNQGFADARNDREAADRNIIANANRQGIQAMRPEIGMFGRETGNMLLLNEERDGDGQIRIKRTVASKRMIGGEQGLGGLAERIAKQIAAAQQKTDEKKAGGGQQLARSLEQAVHSRTLRVRVTNRVQVDSPLGAGPKPGSAPTR